MGSNAVCVAVGRELEQGGADGNGTHLTCVDRERLVEDLECEDRILGVH